MKNDTAGIPFDETYVQNLIFDSLDNMDEQQQQQLKSSDKSSVKNAGHSSRTPTRRLARRAVTESEGRDKINRRNELLTSNPKKQTGGGSMRNLFHNTNRRDELLTSTPKKKTGGSMRNLFHNMTPFKKKENGVPQMVATIGSGEKATVGGKGKGKGKATDKAKKNRDHHHHHHHHHFRKQNIKNLDPMTILSMLEMYANDDDGKANNFLAQLKDTESKDTGGKTRVIPNESAFAA